MAKRGREKGKGKKESKASQAVGVREGERKGDTGRDRGLGWVCVWDGGGRKGERGVTEERGGPKRG